MFCKRVIGIFFIMVIVSLVSATPIEHTADSGQVPLKKAADTARTVIDSSSQIETGDTLLIGDTLEAEGTPHVEDKEDEVTPKEGLSATEVGVDSTVSGDSLAAPVEKAVSEKEKAPVDEEAVKEPEEEIEPTVEPKEAEKEKAEKEKEAPAKSVWEISAAMVTVDNEQWTRIAVAVDVPIWRFGVCFDLELFLDAQGDFSNKAWDFSSGKKAGESLLRKIRYIRFNHLGDPLFIKIGGLDNVTFCYGFIVDRFTNMLHYPGDKLFGLQFDLNDLGPVGVSIQTLIADFMDFGNDGGILAGRLAFKPFKATEKPIIGGLSIGGMVATDLNQYAPAREWDYNLYGDDFDKDEDGIIDGDWQEKNHILIHGDSINQSKKLKLINAGEYDTAVVHKDEWAKDKENRITILGGDLIIPIISSKILNLDLYAQTGVTLDEENENDDKIYKGWGIGAPGIAVKAGPFWGRVEFRHTEDQFSPGYFGTYYFDERITRNPNVSIKENSLKSVDMNGVFGILGFNILNVLILGGSYQRLVGDDALDQRFEAEAGIGDVLLERIPKINKVEVFYYQSEIDGNFFYQSPTTYWGYRIGCEVLAGASIIWETRYGWVWNKDKSDVVDDKTMTIKACLSF